MRLFISIILSSFFIFSHLSLSGQIISKTVKDAILISDSVLLVSHNLTEQKIVQDEIVKIRKSPPIVLNGRPNKKIIHESVLLTAYLKNQLISILTQPNHDSERNLIKCFLPHHSILLIKNGKTSYIEICFECERLLASQGIGLSDINYPKLMCKQLETFFSSLGIKYQIPYDPNDPLDEFK